MMVGTTIICCSIYFRLYETTVDCANDDMNLIFGGIIYSSYLILFVQFALNKYVFTGTGASNSKVKQK